MVLLVDELEEIAQNAPRFERKIPQLEAELENLRMYLAVANSDFERGANNDDELQFLFNEERRVENLLNLEKRQAEFDVDSYYIKATDENSSLLIAFGVRGDETPSLITFDDFVGTINVNGSFLDPQSTPYVVVAGDGACFWNSIYESSKINGGLFEDFGTLDRADEGYQDRVDAVAKHYQDQLTGYNFERIKESILQSEVKTVFDQKTKQIIPTANAKLATKFELMQYGDDYFAHMRDVEFSPRAIRRGGASVWPEIELAMFLAHMTGTQIIVICMDVSSKITGCPRVFYFNQEAPVSAILVKTNGHYDIVDFRGTLPPARSTLPASPRPSSFPQSVLGLPRAGSGRIRDMPSEFVEQRARSRASDEDYAQALQLAENDRAARENRDFAIAHQLQEGPTDEQAIAKGIAAANRFFI